MVDITETVWDLENWIEQKKEELRKAGEAADRIPQLEEDIASFQEQLRRMKRATRWDEPGDGAVPAEA